jgi:hypothetical protein
MYNPPWIVPVIGIPDKLMPAKYVVLDKVGRGTEFKLDVAFGSEFCDGTLDGKGCSTDGLAGSGSGR